MLVEGCVDLSLRVREHVSIDFFVQSAGAVSHVAHGVGLRNTQGDQYGSVIVTEIVKASGDAELFAYTVPLTLKGCRRNADNRVIVFSLERTKRIDHG